MQLKNGTRLAIVSFQPAKLILLSVLSNFKRNEKNSIKRNKPKTELLNVFCNYC